ncbi:hypothetical protein HOA92_05480 [archaeon]|nr:hypothetical protein [archaeon]MBT6762464.1 hypothetical protein [archaeon]
MPRPKCPHCWSRDWQTTNNCKEWKIQCLECNFSIGYEKEEQLYWKVKQLGKV